MPDTLHQELAQGRWYTLSLMEQLGNIGGEVGRAIAQYRKGIEPQNNRALDRALELFDLTLDDPRWKQQRRMRELCRAREVVCDVLYGDGAYGKDTESLERYFMYFAYAARKEKIG